MGNQPWHDRETLVELYHVEGKSLREVADHFDITPQSVVYWMEKHDIDRRQSPANQKHASFGHHPSGYEHWRCYVDGTNHRVRVHRLLAVSEFGLDAVKDKHVHHKNRIPWDNRAENLEVLSVSEHTERHRPEWEEKRREAVSEVTTGQSNPKSKLTPEDVIEIRRRYDNGESTGSIAEDFDMNYNTMRRIGKRKSWSHIREQD